MEKRQIVGFFLGPLAFVSAYLSPLLRGNAKAHILLSIFFFTIVWWVTECIPIPITALLIPVLITIFGITSVEKAFAPFANPVIMLFLGSFMLAQAMSIHGLDKKFAYSILSLKVITRRKSRILFAFGAITAFISMWVSNTATTAMMLPIALGILNTFPEEKEKGMKSTFTGSLLLLTAYASSVGGVGTPVGSPPNLITMSMAQKLAGFRITFFQWTVIGLIVLIPMFFAMYFYMRFKMRKINKSTAGPQSPGSLFHEDLPKKLTRPQKNVLIAFSITVFLWIAPGFVAIIFGKNSAFSLWLERNLPESVVALIGASLLFLLPVDLKKGEFTLPLRRGLDIDWGTLLLFGGGLSMGIQMFETGLADSIGKFFIQSGGGSASLSLITLISIVFCIYFTEIASNTAAANMTIPIVIAICQTAGVNPLPAILGGGMACSFAFMMPISTPPNAIIYGSRLVPLPFMIKYGFWMNIFGIIIIWTAIRVIAPLLGLL
jgi:sodium-dependent dicarboxylate transporter 2/3/5